ncbi:MAG: HD domain-containing phosphohydrolase [Planctomycetaceae bacterium]
MPSAADASQRLQSLSPQWCAELAGWFRSLLGASTARSSELRHLVRQLILDVCEIRNPRRLLEWVFADITSSFPGAVSDAERQVYVSGIQTARMMAWSAGHLPAWRQQLDVLAMGALLQDCGFLVLAEHRSSGLLKRHAHQHPTVGMALASGIEGVSMQIPLIVAQHHERNDGLGFPEQLPHRELLPASRYLAIAVSFREAACALIDASKPEPSRFTFAIQESARRLHRAAECGAFDFALTTQFLEQLELLPGASPPHASQVSGRLIRTDLQHCWQGPHRPTTRQSLRTLTHLETQ